MTSRIFKPALFVTVMIGIAAIPGAAHPAWGIAVDRQGQIYFSALKTVWKIDVQGRTTVIWNGGDKHTHELNVDQAGNVFGAENSYDPATQKFFAAIWQITPRGEFSYVLPPAESVPPGTSIWKDKTGSSYHIGSFPGRELLVLKRAADGTVSVLAGDRSAVRNYRQSMPYSIGASAFGPDGSLYFVHGSSISRISPDGRIKPVTGAAEQDGAGAGLFGIAVDTQGNVYTADYNGKRVLRIAPDGRRKTVLTAEDRWHPSGVAAKGGDLYALESNIAPDHRQIGTRVRKLARDGKVSVLASVGESVVTGNSTSRNSMELKEERRRLLLPAIGGASVLICIAGVVLLKRRRGRKSGRVYDSHHHGAKCES